MKKLKTILKETWDIKKERYKVTLSDGCEIDIRFDQGVGKKGVYAAIQEEAKLGRIPKGIKVVKIETKASRPTLNKFKRNTMKKTQLRSIIRESIKKVLRQSLINEGNVDWFLDTGKKNHIDFWNDPAIQKGKLTKDIVLKIAKKYKVKDDDAIRFIKDMFKVKFESITEAKITKGSYVTNKKGEVGIVDNISGDKTIADVRYNNGDEESIPVNKLKIFESVNEASDNRSHILLKVPERNYENMIGKLQDMNINHSREPRNVIKVYTDPTSGWYRNSRAQYKLMHDVWVDKFVVKESVNEAIKIEKMSKGDIEDKIMKIGNVMKGVKKPYDEKDAINIKWLSDYLKKLVKQLNKLEESIKKEPLTEAFKSKRLSNIYNMLDNSDKEFFQRMHNTYNIDWANVPDALVGKGSTGPGINLFFATKTKKNPWAKKDWFSTVNPGLIGVTIGKKPLYITTSRWADSTGKQNTLSTKGPGYASKILVGKDQHEINNFKRFNTLSDIVFHLSLVDLKKWDPSDIQNIRKQRKMGALAFIDDKDFAKANRKRYEQILKDKIGGRTGVDEMIKRAVAIANTLMTGAFENLRTGKYGGIIAGQDPKGFDITIRDITDNISKASNLYSRYVQEENEGKLRIDDINKQLEKEKDPKKIASLRGTLDYYLEYIGKNTQEYALQLKGYLNKLEGIKG